MKKELTKINDKIYYFAISIVILAMLMGLLWDDSYLGNMNTGFLLHAGLIFILSLSLVLYPMFDNRATRIVMITGAAAYFYTLFYLYPETWSTFIYICLIPVIAILFFDSKLFYYAIFLNSTAVSSAFVYISLTKQEKLYPFFYEDWIGHFINFLGVQILLCILYYLTYVRMQKQQAYYKEVQESERIKTAGQLAAAFAHEIRNPLTVVKGFLQLYEQDSAYDHHAKKHFSLMINELDMAEEVISQFLAVSKPNKEAVVEEVHLKENLQSVASLLASYGLMNDNKIELYVEEGCRIAANSMEFKQLCINIIKNAIEASTEGCSVIVNAKREKDKVEIQIIDRGNGMSEIEMQSLGTPFYSLKSKGTGLGLMICYNIVSKYNGKITFQSLEGEGTTVTIQFPEY
ncbi:HAMP domain-containing histidine kinase [Domibacillus sp. A3M-37]|uniref:sensor histidine kinase n=1 Tax=Domibacillus sp. A3M-37 TaxID=2962037 RepID=UPI0020B825B9|nr:HAMP domain-containing sensor histidine kinase [Domibacillus sp. A3M-37]MCP3762466.1 HAMP domain-containing histidine kinase [Domibacillus sp. A3M-37]